MRFWTDRASAKGLIELRRYRISRKLVQSFRSSVYVVKQRSCTKLVASGIISISLSSKKYVPCWRSLSNSSSKVSKEFALYSIREKLFQIKKKRKKKRVSRIRIDPKNTLSRELRWILLNGTFHFLFARAYIPPLYRSMFQFPRSIANYDDMEPDFSPVATIIDNCIRNFQQSKIIP